MSLRLPVYFSLVFLLVVFTTSMTTPVQQAPNRPEIWPKWEYKMLRLEGPSCLYENQVTGPLNALGQQSWELVTFERPAPLFPREADGDMLIRPAATGPNKDVVPQTADSFEGKISMKMEQQQLPACSMLLKRPIFPPAK